MNNKCQRRSKEGQKCENPVKYKVLVGGVAWVELCGLCAEHPLHKERKEIKNEKS